MLVDPVLKDEWFAVLRSDELKEKPMQVILMGERIAIFRTQDGVHAFKDLCIHRGSALSLGRVVDDTLVCAYHGWKYDAQGRCVCIPAQKPEAAIPKKAVAQVYRCTERYGLIWVSLGNPPRGVPEFPQFEDERFTQYWTGPFIIKATPPRIIENYLDYSHLMWVHDGVLGDSSKPQIEEYRIHRIDDTLVSDPVVIHEYADMPDGRKVVPNIYVKKALRPCVGYLQKFINSNKEHELASMIIASPIDESTTKAYMIVAQNFDPELSDEQMLETSNLVMAQDVEILENQRPEELPLDLQAELSLRSDQMSIAYRKWLGELNIHWGTA